jgi:hypothetical protein
MAIQQLVFLYIYNLLLQQYPYQDQFYMLFFLPVLTLVRYYPNLFQAVLDFPGTMQHTADNTGSG